ncbi:hypothetical protein GCM10007895_17340 [Paraferrimonas sedimenticola]|uniref:Outer membrane protein beta-barrel domain-containing protein n=2 Tax=Paraferrimonas sedimenticola TaxID=375674 RepID=A0AA37RWL8_9GAMM|nr:hypothetical protein GCM10007895_17340 [Paraferrimonas sedimenticola]
MLARCISRYSAGIALCTSLFVGNLHAQTSPHAIEFGLDTGIGESKQLDQKDDVHSRFSLAYRYQFSQHWSAQLTGTESILKLPGVAHQQYSVRFGTEYKAQLTNTLFWIANAGLGKDLLSQEAKDLGFDHGLGAYLGTGLRFEFDSGFNLSATLAYEDFEIYRASVFGVNLGYRF